MRISDWSSDVCSSDLRDNAIPGKRTKTSPAHDADEPLDHQQRNNEGNHETNAYIAPADHSRRELVAIFEEFQCGRAQHGGNGQKEAELRGCPSLHAQRQCPQYRSAGATDAWNHGKALDETDPYRAAQRDFSNAVNIRALYEPLDHQDRDSSNDQRDRHHPGRAET